MSIITTEVHNDILPVKPNNPPVNALGLSVRQGLMDAIYEAENGEYFTKP